MNHIDVIIVGAGAAGLLCAIEAGARGRHVLILEKSNKVGKKILMSGGGRCNFTNIYTTPQQYLSQNPHFCKSALNRYTPPAFIDLVEHHRIAYYEKTLGQLFCEQKSIQIVEMLLNECRSHHVDIQLNQTITSVEKKNDTFIVTTNDAHYQCQSLVIASGGLSIPTLGSSPFGYHIAEQFGITVHPLRAGLVPLTWHQHDKLRFESLSGISIDSRITSHGKTFEESLLFTHRGLSGPAVLQISSYWQPGDELIITLLPQLDLYKELNEKQIKHGDSALKTMLSQHYPKRLLTVFFESTLLDKPLKQLSQNDLKNIAHHLQHWRITPNGTEGYRTAEVTLGGVDCNELSSQRMEAKKVPGLFFIGEVIDVSGWLGGYNFQWAWASGWAAGQVV